MSAFFIVRANVPADDRPAFDTWYATQHLPVAMTAFGCGRARRGWQGCAARTREPVVLVRTLED